jgi:hypothetical protein
MVYIASIIDVVITRQPMTTLGVIVLENLHTPRMVAFVFCTPFNAKVLDINVLVYVAGHHPLG